MFCHSSSHGYHQRSRIVQEELQLAVAFTPLRSLPPVRIYTRGDARAQVRMHSQFLLSIHEVRISTEDQGTLLGKL